MKQYQDEDTLHGNGKASPKPKMPNQSTFRGQRWRMSQPEPEYKAVSHRFIITDEKGEHTVTSLQIVRETPKAVEIKRAERKAKKSN